MAADAALLGHQSCFVTALPDSPVALACLDQLRGLGVDVSGVARANGRMGIYYVEAGANQRSTNVIYDREGSAIALAEPTAFDWKSLLHPGDRFHVSGITPALSRHAALSSVRAVAEAKRIGATVSLDLNYRSKLWNWQEGTDHASLARKVISEMLPYVDLLVGNEEDADSVLGIHAGRTDVHAGQIEHAKYIDVAQQIMARWPSISQLAFTLRGSVSASHNRWAGMLWSDGEAYFAPTYEGQLKPHEITHIVDRMGAGDSFVAALLVALEEAQPPQRAIEFAVAASCLKHSIPGDYNFATRAEIQSLMAGSASGRVVR